MKKTAMLLLLTIYSLMVFAQERKLTEIKPDQLPKGVKTWVDQNAPGGKIVRAAKMVELNVLTYIAVVESKEQKRSYQFDKDGKFIGKADKLFNNEDLKTKGPKASPPGANTDPPQGGTPVVQPPVKTTDPKAVPPAGQEAPKK
jgi:hypothetical protein